MNVPSKAKSVPPIQYVQQFHHLIEHKTEKYKMKMTNKPIHIITFTIVHNRWYYILVMDNIANSDMEHWEQISFFKYTRTFVSPLHSAQKLEYTLEYMFFLEKHWILVLYSCIKFIGMICKVSITNIMISTARLCFIGIYIWFVWGFSSH